MDGGVNAATAEQRAVGGVDDRGDPLLRQVADDELERRG
jgi:hypothetical protein